MDIRANIFLVGRSSKYGVFDLSSPSGFNHVQTQLLGDWTKRCVPNRLEDVVSGVQ